MRRKYTSRNYRRGRRNGYKKRRYAKQRSQPRTFRSIGFRM